jgi:hypothetical protein
MLETIVKRVKKIQDDPTEAAEVDAKITELLDLWVARQRSGVQQGAPMTYSGRKGTTAALLELPQPNRWTRWNAPNSLRETEHTINLLLSTSDASVDEARPYVVRRDDAPMSAIPTVEDLDVSDTEAEE